MGGGGGDTGGDAKNATAADAIVARSVRPSVRVRVDDVHKVHHYHHMLNFASTVAIDKQARAEETEYYRVALDKI